MEMALFEIWCDFGNATLQVCVSIDGLGGLQLCDPLGDKRHKGVRLGRWKSEAGVAMTARVVSGKSATNRIVPTGYLIKSISL